MRAPAGRDSSAPVFRVLLISAGDDLRALIDPDSFLLSYADTIDAVDQGVDLVIADGDNDVSARHEHTVPVLWVSSSHATENEYLTDTITRPLVQAELKSRMRALAELGRMRRSQSTAARQISRSFFDVILEELPAGVLTADGAERISFINQSGRRMLGISSNDPLELSLSELLDFPPAFILSREGSQRSSIPFRRLDGREVELGLTITPTEGLHPDIEWFVLFRDLSSTRESELTARRVERLVAIGTMVTGFAHEVRNPVSAMRSLIEVLDEETPSGDPRRPTLAKLLRHLDRIERLVKSSLKFGRPVEARRTPTIPQRITEEAVEQLRPRTRSIGDIRVEVSANLPEVDVDEAQMVQVLVALLNNALDATGYPDQITLRADQYFRAGEHGVFVEVRDFGPGIQNHVIGRVFDPFFTTKAGGTGLGLSIAQRLVQDNGGRLEASSIPGLGATFTVFLPTIVSAAV